MIYRGFKIERHQANGIQPPSKPAFGGATTYTEYKVMESAAADMKWHEIGIANDLGIAKELVDRVITARERFLKVVGFAR